jgi:hypothetical protein
VGKWRVSKVTKLYSACYRSEITTYEIVGLSDNFIDVLENSAILSSKHYFSPADDSRPPPPLLPPPRCPPCVQPVRPRSSSRSCRPQHRCEGFEEVENERRQSDPCGGLLLFVIPVLHAERELVAASDNTSPYSNSSRDGDGRHQHRPAELKACPSVLGDRISIQPASAE